MPEIRAGDAPPPVTCIAKRLNFRGIENSSVKIKNDCTNGHRARSFVGLDEHDQHVRVTAREFCKAP
jgi:hypothetical protein